MALDSQILSVKVEVDSSGAVKGFKTVKGQSDSLEKAISQTVSELKAADKGFNRVGDSAEVAANQLVLFSDGANKSTVSAKQLVEVQRSTTSSFESAKSSVTALSTAITALAQAYDLITNERALAQLSKTLRALAFVADMKGLEVQAEHMRELSDSVATFQADAEGLSAELDKVIDRAVFFDRALEGVKVASEVAAWGLAGLAVDLYRVPLEKQAVLAKDLGIALYRSGGSFKDAKPWVDDFTNGLKNFSTQTQKIKASLEPVSDALGAVKRDSETAAKGFASLGNVSKTALKGGLLSIVETSSVAGASLALIGGTLVNLDSTFAKVTGTIAVFASVLLGSVGLAFNIVAGWIGGLIESLGDKLISSMSAFEEKALKLTNVMNQFTFTVRGFNQVYGEEAVGSLKLWQEALEETVETTIFTRQETAKAIKLLVAEGKTLGLSVADTTQLLAKARDVAAATGYTLDDVVQRFISGLAGSSQAVLALGINTSEAALNQLELVKSTGKTVSALSEQDKIMARLQEIMIATKPIMGAAAAGVTTVAGAYAMLGKRIDEIQGKLGEQGAFTRAYLTVFTKLAEAFLSLPDPIIEVVGALQDFFGVTFKILGVIIKYSLTIVALSTVYGLASSAISNFIVVQAVLTKTMGFLGAAVGAQTIAVTSLSAVWTNFGILIKASVLSSVGILSAGIASLAKGLGTLLISFAPLALTLAKIGAAVYLVYSGFKVVERETKIFSSSVDGLVSVFDNLLPSAQRTGSSFSKLSALLGQLRNVLVATASSAVAGFVGGINAIAAAIFKLLAILTSFSDKLSSVFQGAFDSAIEKASSLSRVILGSVAVIASLGEESANASVKINQAGDSAEAYTVKLKGVYDATDELTQKLREVELLRATGNDLAAASIERQVIALKLQTEQQTEAREELIKSLIRTQGSLDKTFEEAIKSSSKSIDESRKAMLQELGDGAAIKEIIALRKKLEGEALREQIIKFKAVADVAGADKAVKSLEEALANLYSTIEREENLKFAVEVNKERIAQSSEAIKRLDGVVENLSQNLREAGVELAKLGASNVGNEGLIGLLAQVDAARQLALADGASLKQADEKAAKATTLAMLLADQLRAVEKLKQANADNLQKIKDAEDELKRVITERKDIDEQILRIGMSREDVAARELEVQLKKLKTLEDQLEKTGKLHDAAKRELDLARETAKVKAQSTVQQGAVSDAQGAVSSIVGGDLGKLLEPLIGKLVSSLGASFAKFANIFALVLKAPDLIGAVASFNDTLRTWPTRLADAIVSLVDSFAKLLEELPSRFANAIPKIIDALIKNVIQDAPRLAGVLMETILVVIDELIKKMPDMAAAFITHIISDTPKMVIGIISALIKMIPKIVSSLIRAIPKMIPAIIKALVEAIAGIGRAVRNMFTDGLTSGLKDAGKSFKKMFTGASSQLFAVMDIMDVTKEAEDAANELIDSAKDAGESIWEALKNAIVKAWKWIVSIGQAIWDGFVWVVEKTWEWIKKIGSTIWDGLVEAAEAVWDWVKRVGAAMWEGFVTTATLAWEWIKSIGAAIWEGLKSAAQSAWEFVKSIGVTIWEGLTDSVEASWEFVKGIGKTLWQAVVDSVSNIWDSLKTAGTKIWEGLAELFSGDTSAAMTKFREAGAAIWTGLKNAWNLGWAALKDLGKVIWDWFVSAWNTGIKALTNVGGAIWQSVSSAFANIGTLFANVGKSAWDSVVAAFANVGSLFGKIGTNAWQSVVSAFANVGSLFSNIGSSAWSSVSAAFANVGSLFGKVGTNAWQSVAGAFSNVGSLFSNIGSSAWTSLSSAFAGVPNLFSKIGSSAWTSLSSAFANVGSLFSGVGTTIYNGVKSAFSGFGGFISGLLDKINPAKLLEKVFAIDFRGEGTVERFLGLNFPFANFAEGGTVPGRAYVPGDSPKNDTFPALLSPGEVVIPRSMLRDEAFRRVLDAKFRGQDVPQYFIGEGTIVGKAVRGDFKGAAKQAAETDWGKELRNALDQLSGLGQAAKDVYTFLKSIGANLPPIKDIIMNPVGALKDAFRGVAGAFFKPKMERGMKTNVGVPVPAEAQIVMQTVRSIVDKIRLPGFNTGGFVGGSGGPDSLVARLTPGEFVMNRQAVNSIGAANLAAMNSGRQAQSSNVNVSVNFTLNTQERIDESFVKQRVLPTIKEELRKESLRGGFVIAAQGVR